MTKAYNIPSLIRLAEMLSGCFQRDIMKMDYSSGSDWKEAGTKINQRRPVVHFQGWLYSASWNPCGIASDSGGAFQARRGWRTFALALTLSGQLGHVSPLSECLWMPPEAKLTSPTPTRHCFHTGSFQTTFCRCAGVGFKASCLKSPTIPQCLSCFVFN